MSAELAAGAARVLRANHTGAMTKAAPGLYPHQWSWDAAFNAIGWAALDVGTATAELDALFAGQWRNGMVPQIVFDPASDGYFPGPDVWACASVSADAPDGVLTSGICQPPVHAIAAGVIHAAGAPGRWLEAIAPKLLAWHRYLARERRDERTGLLAIIHGWESGTDNSPRWDGPYARVPAGSLDGYVRRDTGHVADLAQRPDDRDYARYIGILEQARDCGYDARRVRATGSFVVGDVLFTAIFAAASDVLAALGDTPRDPTGGVPGGVPGGVLGDVLGDDETAELRGFAADARAAVLAQVDPATGLAADVDLRTGEALRTETIAGFAPLVAGHAPEELRRTLTELIAGPRWTGHPALRWPVPPSTSPESPAFDPRRYWRGPVWPVISWLLSWALSREGETAAAESIARASLDQLGDGSFAEYYEPFTGEALGSRDQSWTAAVALDWVVGAAWRSVSTAAA